LILPLLVVVHRLPMLRAVGTYLSRDNSRRVRFGSTRSNWQYRLVVDSPTAGWFSSECLDWVASGIENTGKSIAGISASNVDVFGTETIILRLSEDFSGSTRLVERSGQTWEIRFVFARPLEGYNQLRLSLPLLPEAIGPYGVILSI
jgi:hypothetical protein